MAKLKRGARLRCVPCGRRIVVDACGLSARTIWCCGKPMSGPKKAAKKSFKKKKKTEKKRGKKAKRRKG